MFQTAKVVMVASNLAGRVKIEVLQCKAAQRPCIKSLKASVREWSMVGDWQRRDGGCALCIAVPAVKLHNGGQMLMVSLVFRNWDPIPLAVTSIMDDIDTYSGSNETGDISM